MDVNKLSELFYKTDKKYPELVIGIFKNMVLASNESDVKFYTLRYISIYLLNSNSKKEDKFDKFFRWFKNTYLKKKSKRKSLENNVVNGRLKNRKIKLKSINRKAITARKKNTQSAKNRFFQNNSEDVIQNNPEDVIEGNVVNGRLKNRKIKLKSINRKAITARKKNTQSAKNRFFQNNYSETYELLGLSTKCPSCHKTLIQNSICSRCNP